MVIQWNMQIFWSNLNGTCMNMQILHTIDRLMNQNDDTNSQQFLLLNYFKRMSAYI